MPSWSAVLTEKLGFDAQRWNEVEVLLGELVAESIPTPSGPPEVVSGDAYDDLILACAVQADVDVLISGDGKHLLPIGERRSMRILTSSALLADASLSRLLATLV